MASELHPWRFELELFPNQLPCHFASVTLRFELELFPNQLPCHFAATPQSDVVRICAHDFQRHGDAFTMTENACFCAFITLRSQFRLPHCSQRTLMEIM